MEAVKGDKVYKIGTLLIQKEVDGGTKRGKTGWTNGNKLWDKTVTHGDLTDGQNEEMRC